MTKTEKRDNDEEECSEKGKCRHLGAHVSLKFNGTEASL